MTLAGAAVTNACALAVTANKDHARDGYRYSDRERYIEQGLVLSYHAYRLGR